jgi:hypothetical protein
MGIRHVAQLSALSSSASRQPRCKHSVRTSRLFVHTVADVLVGNKLPAVGKRGEHTRVLSVQSACVMAAAKKIKKYFHTCCIFFVFKKIISNLAHCEYNAVLCRETNQIIYK